MTPAGLTAQQLRGERELERVKASAGPCSSTWEAGLGPNAAARTAAVDSFRSPVL